MKVTINTPIKFKKKVVKSGSIDLSDEAAEPLLRLGAVTIDASAQADSEAKAKAEKAKADADAKAKAQGK